MAAKSMKDEPADRRRTISNTQEFTQFCRCSLKHYGRVLREARSLWKKIIMYTEELVGIHGMIGWMSNEAINILSHFVLNPQIGGLGSNTIR